MPAHRRPLLPLALAAAVLLAACGGGAADDAASPTDDPVDETAAESPDDAPDDADAPDADADDAADAGGWSYTDDRGDEITLDAVPERIVAQVSSAAALEDLGVEVIGTFGPLVTADGEAEDEALGLDPDAVTDITGEAYGEVNLEQLAALDPDLVVTGYYPDSGALWHLIPDTEAAAAEIAPVLAVDLAGRPLEDTIAAYEDLADALGADVEAPAVVESRAAFDAATARVEDLAGQMADAGQEVLVNGGTAEDYFVVVPSKAPDLTYYAELGVPFVEPQDVDEELGGYWQRLSWEQADAYEGDVIMWDGRAASLPPEEMKANPVFAALPAAAEDRFVEWVPIVPPSWAAYAEVMDRLVDELEAKLP